MRSLAMSEEKTNKRVRINLSETAKGLKEVGAEV
jgi:hypothetical protein